MAYAFRCRNCQSLLEAAAAGERTVPIKCPTCGAGVSWRIADNGDPIKTENPANWIVLADLSDEELEAVLKFHGDIDIEAHEPFYSVLDEHNQNIYNPDGSVLTAPVGTSHPAGHAPGSAEPRSVEASVSEAPGSKDVTA